MSGIVDRRDLDFVLYEMLDAGRLLGHGRFAAFDRDAIRQILDTAQHLAEDRFLPVAALVDAEEPQFVDGGVRMPGAAAEALRAYAEAGFCALPFPEDAGGLQAPWFLHTAVSGMFFAANTAVANYAFLTIAAANLLAAFGSPGLKALYLPRMLAGDWFGTMCLSEPQAGSSLGDIRTTAVPAGDGLYGIRGTKMWISGGEQTITENIVHMVLAKLPDAAPGTRGISLFLVPKRRLGPEGAPGAGNNIALAGLNHKMGQRGTTNCLLNFGETGDCLGHLIGEPGRGIEYMFHMMNEARIGVGHAATMAGLAGYLHSAAYAMERTQGRPLAQRDPAMPQVPIVQHADVRRMLLAQKAAVEGAQALCLYCATLVDAQAIAPDARARGTAAALLGLLTPVVKSWPSEHCLEANKWAIQILGGYGYTRDHPLERLYRDNRLNHIHEGTFGIQGLDLLNRKIAGDGGQTLALLTGMMRETVAEALPHHRLADAAARLSGAVDVLDETAQALLGCDDVALRSANATLFLDAFGHVVIGWIWLRQAVTAAAALTALPGKDAAFYDAKLRACDYFHRYELPLARARLALCAALDDTCLTAPPEDFGL